MSHNINTVGSAEPNRQSEITGVEFGIGGKIIISQDESDNYSNSPATSLTNSTLYFYDSSPINEISGASITSSSNWVSSITLPPGRYLLQAGYNVVFSSSGQFAFQWHDGSSFVGTRAQIGATVQFPTESAMGLTMLLVTLDSDTTYEVKSPTGNTNVDTVANQTTTPSTFGFIRIEQL